MCLGPGSLLVKVRRALEVYKRKKKKGIEVRTLLKKEEKKRF